MPCQAFCIISVNSNRSYSPETLNFGSKSVMFLAPCELKIWRMYLKNNRASLLCYFKLRVSSLSYWWIQTGVTDRKCPIRIKIGDILSCVTLKFDGWPWKIIEHLFYDTSSFVHHFISIGEFNLELQSGNAKLGANFVLTSVSLTFDRWSWPFAWTSLLHVVKTSENIMMLWWQEY